jgi:hypothetical protein
VTLNFNTTIVEWPVQQYRTICRDTNPQVREIVNFTARSCCRQAGGYCRAEAVVAVVLCTLATLDATCPKLELERFWITLRRSVPGRSSTK